MNMNKEKTVIKVFTPTSFEGVSGVAVLEELIQDRAKLEVIYTRHVDFREYQQFNDANIVVVLGFPYKGYALPDNFYISLDVPFVDFIHICTYGEEITGVNQITSIVDENKDPIKVLTEIIQSTPSQHLLSNYVEHTDKSMQLVDAINAYRTWTWENHGLSRVLLSLYHASYKRMPHMIKNRDIMDIIKNYAPIIKGQMEKMDDYISRKLESVKNIEVNIDGERCLLKVVFAEEYINELANKILEIPSNIPVVVCVGRTTRGSDMLSIRSSKIHAGRVAQLINDGKGKDAVASVFTDVSYAELIGNSIKTKLDRLQE